MRTHVWISLAGIACCTLQLAAQSILFNFDDAPLRAPLPVALTVGGITASFSATGQGYSIQDASAPVVPAGFTGRFIYPSSVFAADLMIAFSKTLTNFSIQYSPQELGCDDSATMRVTAYLDATLVGAATATAPAPGTWPIGSLRFGSTQGFNHVVVHYDSRPPTCQDYGPIFLADNMEVTPAPEPPKPIITSIVQTGTNLVVSGLNGVPDGNYIVLGSTNAALPRTAWTPLLTNSFDAAGSFAFGRTNLMPPYSLEQYYLLRLP